MGLLIFDKKNSLQLDEPVSFRSYNSSARYSFPDFLTVSRLADHAKHVFTNASNPASEVSWICRPCGSAHLPAVDLICSVTAPGDGYVYRLVNVDGKCPLRCIICGNLLDQRGLRELAVNTRYARQLHAELTRMLECYIKEPVYASRLANFTSLVDSALHT